MRFSFIRPAYVFLPIYSMIFLGFFLGPLDTSLLSFSICCTFLYPLSFLFFHTTSNLFFVTAPPFHLIIHAHWRYTSMLTYFLSNFQSSYRFSTFFTLWHTVLCTQASYNLFFTLKNNLCHQQNENFITFSPVILSVATMFTEYHPLLLTISATKAHFSF